jgi:imidazolonepropionase
MNSSLLIGPFSQIVTMKDLPKRGPISDTELAILKNAGIRINKGKIIAIDAFDALQREAQNTKIETLRLQGKHTCFPGFIDCHTHICYGGSRATDYAMRNAGKTYLEIAKQGGGIWDTVTKTRNADKSELIQGIVKRAKQHLKNGVTTVEVKSGYGLSIREEIKMLEAIKEANELCSPDLIPTCLAAHMKPRDFDGNEQQYLQMIISELLPVLKQRELTNRIDAFIEETAFNPETILPYFKSAKDKGFDIIVHADQFSVGGSRVAIEVGAISADHLEASTQKEIEMFAKSKTIATALPGASLGLGVNFTPARKLLDSGAILAIASDHNPGSAPMGDLLTQAAVLGSFEKLTNAEVLAGITIRAAAALNLTDRGQITQGSIADLCIFHTDDYREVLYNQGSFKPCMVYKQGKLVYNKHK